MTKSQLAYEVGLSTIATGKPTDYSNRTPHPPVLATAYLTDTWHRPELPAGKFIEPRVVLWTKYMVGIIHGDDGNTYAFAGDNVSMNNVTAIYLLAEQMHI